MRGAGGNSGGAGRFFLGIAMLCGGIYLLLNAITVTGHYGGFGGRLYRFGGFPITTGMVLIPFMFGVGIMFYDSRKWYGWLLAGGSLLALVFGVISSIHFQFARMSAFDIIVILVLAVGGLGLLLGSLRGTEDDPESKKE